MEHHLTEEVSHVEHEFARGWNAEGRRIRRLRRQTRGSGPATVPIHFDPINLSLLQGQRIRIFSAVPLGTAARIDQYDARGLIPWLDRPRCSSSSPVDAHPGTHGHGGLHHPDTAAPAWNETFSHHMLSVLVSVGFPLMVVAIVFLLAAAVTACIRRRTNRAAAATTGRPSPPASSRPAPAAASFAHAPPPPPLYGYVAVNQQGQSPSLYY